MVRQDARLKKNGEMRCEKKNGDTRQKTKKNREKRCRQKKMGRQDGR